MNDIWLIPNEILSKKNNAGLMRVICARKGLDALLVKGNVLAGSVL